MIIDTLNTFHWKRELSGNVSSDVMVTSGDADPNLWLFYHSEKLQSTKTANVSLSSELQFYHSEKLQSTKTIG